MISPGFYVLAAPSSSAASILASILWRECSHHSEFESYVNFVVVMKSWAIHVLNFVCSTRVSIVCRI